MWRRDRLVSTPLDLYESLAACESANRGATEPGNHASVGIGWRVMGGAWRNFRDVLAPEQRALPAHHGRVRRRQSRLGPESSQFENGQYPGARRSFHCQQRVEPAGQVSSG